MVAILEAPVEPFEIRNGDDDPLFEILNGKKVELPPKSILLNRVTSRIHGSLGRYVSENLLGEVVAHALLKLALPIDRNRRPDVAFISAQAIADAPPQAGSENAWAVRADLVVEVLSPHDAAEDVAEKIEEYFASGTRLVWVVYPNRRLVYHYESPHQVRVLGATDELDGGAVLPGYRVAVSSLFPA